MPTVDLATSQLLYTCTYACMLSCFRCVWPFATLWTVALQAPVSMGFSRQEYCSGLPHPPPGDLPDPGIESQPPALEADSLPKRSLGTRQGDHLAGHTYSFLCSFTYRPEFSPKVIESCQITQILVSPRVVYFPVAY